MMKKGRGIAFDVSSKISRYVFVQKNIYKIESFPGFRLKLEHVLIFKSCDYLQRQKIMFYNNVCISVIRNLRKIAWQVEESVP